MDIEAAAQLAAGGKAGMTVHDNERVRKAVIENGKVANIIIAAADWGPEGMMLVDAGEAEIGWLYANGVLVPPTGV
jgi:hypothetical protein